MKKLFLTLCFLLITSQVWGVTEFVCSVMPSGGDYSTLSSWEAAIDCNLTTAKTQEYDGAVGTIADAAAVTWDAGASSGTLLHMSTVAKSGKDAFLLTVTGGTLADDDVIDDGAAHTITVKGTPDSVQATAKIDGDWSGGADTTAVTIAEWTTDATRYINIYTTTAARHKGIYSTSYYLLTASGSPLLAVLSSYVTITGIQAKNTNSTYASTTNNTINNGIGTGINFVIISKCIAIGGRYTIKAEDSSGSLYVLNSIVYNDNTSAQGAIVCVNGLMRVYSTTAIGKLYGIRQIAGTLIAKNCYAKGDTGAYNGTITQTTCAAADTTSDVGALDNIAYSITNFVNVTAGSENLHLATGSALIDVGTDTSGDSSINAALGFTDDIDGVTRSGTWDIGADEYVTARKAFMRAFIID